MNKLSIIIPCYNCEDTLEAAVASVFGQDPAVPFDVTMVDDGSTDGTYGVMTTLAETYPNMKLLRHSTNQGGGAARNTAAAHSRGDVIFCLDSDDILGPDFLRNMTRFWLKKKCDGLGMSTSIKFKKSNVADVAYTTEFEGPGKRVRFESFLDGSPCSLNVVFMISRAAFNRLGGYPTEHGFDTQGMAFRFLCNGLTAYTCPETVYYQRVAFGESYYLREYNAERKNWNWLNILEEFLYLFRNQVKAELLASDLFPVPGEPVPPDLMNIVRGKADVYASDYRRLIRLGRDGMGRVLRGSGDKFDQYWLGAYYLSAGKYQKAIAHFSRAMALGFNYRMIHYRVLLASLRLAGAETSPARSFDELSAYCQPYPISKLPFGERMFRRLIANRRLRGPALWLKGTKDRLRRPRGAG